MSARPDYSWRTYAEPDPAPRVHVTNVAKLTRRNGELSIAVLRRPGMDPILSLQHTNPGGTAGARTDFRPDELDALEKAIALARRPAGRDR